MDIKKIIDAANYIHKSSTNERGNCVIAPDGFDKILEEYHNEQKLIKRKEIINKILNK